jgi:hypothetical protein
MAVILGYATFPTWYLLVSRPVDAQLPPPGHILAISSIGNYEEASMSMDIAPATGQPDDRIPELFGQSGVQDGATLTIYGSARDWQRSDVVHVLFTGRFADAAESCYSHGNRVQVVGWEDLPEAVLARFESDNLIGPPFPSERRAARLTLGDGYDDDIFVLQCEISDAALWVRDRQRHYLSFPQLYFVRWGIADIPDADSRRRREFFDGLPEPGDCVEISYSDGRHERIEEADTRQAVEATGEQGFPGSRVWRTCERFGTLGSDFRGKDAWLTWKGFGLSRLIVTDIVAEGTNERNLFVGGVALGLVGALLVEALGSIIQAVELGFKNSRRWRSVSSLLDGLEDRWRRRPEGQRRVGYEQPPLW